MVCSCRRRREEAGLPLLLLLLATAAGLAAAFKNPSCHEVRTAFQLRQIGPLKLVPDVPTVAGQYYAAPGGTAVVVETPAGLRRVTESGGRGITNRRHLRQLLLLRSDQVKGT